MKLSRTILSVAIALTVGLMTTAQEMPQMPKLPLDPAVRYGVLDNGLTYYIRHNEHPKGQADFYIAQNVGSILEDENQRGLAHFLEHMCFNGTDNFPGNSLITWLESVGVKFGYNLNAYTSIDETVYNISSVPVAREGVQDSCLLILHDWATGLTLDTAEINAERPVIHEEWRSRNVGQMRILEQILPTMYPDSRYGHRLPIGLMSVVDSFPPQALIDYYHKWYRPDQQAILVVGDIDVDRIETKIKELFGPIPAQADAAERLKYPVPDTEGTIFAVGSDKEQGNFMAELFIKHDVLPEQLVGTQADLVQDFILSLITGMINERLSDIASKPDAPFGMAQVDYSEYFLSRTKDALGIVAISRDEKLPEALASAYREFVRAAKGGFTQGELDRARSEYLSTLEKAYNNRDKATSDQLVRELVRNFTEGEAVPGVEVEYQLAQAVSPMISLDMVNQAVAQLLRPDNRVVMAMMPEREGLVLPTEKDFEAALDAVDAENIEAFVENVKTEPLIEALPASGKVVAKEDFPAMEGAEKWTLSNGINVIVCPTKLKADEILFRAEARGGLSVVDDAMAADIIYMPYALNSQQLGTYTDADLRKYLAGKQVSVSPSFGNYTRTISGNSTKADLPTLFELVYSQFAAPGLDEAEFEAGRQQMSGVLAHQQTTPNYVFSKRVLENLSTSPKRRILETATIDAASRENIVALNKQMVANPADYTFFFVGSFEKDSIQGLIENYIACLPVDESKSVPFTVDPALRIRPGVHTEQSVTPMETPQTFAAIIASGDETFDPETSLLMSAAGQILSKRLLDIVREKEGAVYSISASANLGEFSEVGGNAQISSMFPMKPEKKDLVLQIIYDQMHNMINDVTADEIAPIKEFRIKQVRQSREENSGVMSNLATYVLTGKNFDEGAEERVEILTPERIGALMNDLLSQNNYMVIVLDAEENQ